MLKYHKRISSPLLDRIDIHIAVPRVAYEKLSGLKLARTIADLADSARIETPHQAEVIQYRPRRLA